MWSVRPGQKYFRVSFEFEMESVPEHTNPETLDVASTELTARHCEYESVKRQGCEGF